MDYKSFVVLVIMFTTMCGGTRRAVARESSPKLNHVYNKVQDITVVSTDAERIPSKLWFSAGYVYEGTKPDGPLRGLIEFHVIRSISINNDNPFMDKLRWKDVDTIYLRFGDTKLSLPAKYLVKEVDNSVLQSMAQSLAGGKYYNEQVAAPIPVETLDRLARADEVLVQVGDTQSTIKGKNLIPLKELAKRMTADSSSPTSDPATTGSRMRLFSPSGTADGYADCVMTAKEGDALRTKAIVTYHDDGTFYFESDGLSASFYPIKPVSSQQPGAWKEFVRLYRYSLSRAGGQNETGVATVRSTEGRYILEAPKWTAVLSPLVTTAQPASVGTTTPEVETETSDLLGVEISKRYKLTFKGGETLEGTAIQRNGDSLCLLLSDGTLAYIVDPKALPHDEPARMGKHYRFALTDGQAFEGTATDSSHVKDGICLQFPNGKQVIVVGSDAVTTTNEVKVPAN